MSAQDIDGGPAFPTDNEQQTGANTWHFAGMTLRDYAAIAFTSALLSNPGLINTSRCIDNEGIKRAVAFGLVAAHTYLELRSK